MQSRVAASALVVRGPFSRSGLSCEHILSLDATSSSRSCCSPPVGARRGCRSRRGPARIRRSPSRVRSEHTRRRSAPREGAPANMTLPPEREADETKAPGASRALSQSLRSLRVLPESRDPSRLTPRPARALRRFSFHCFPAARRPPRECHTSPPRNRRIARGSRAWPQ